VRTLIRARGEDDGAGAQLSGRCAEDEPAVESFDRVDRHVLSHGSLHPGRVALEEADDFVARHESVRVGSVVVAVRELHGPVRRHEAEAVPAVAPRLSDPAALQDDMLDAGLRQLAARREARLACADDDNGDRRLGHARIFSDPSAREKPIVAVRA
jgi:hypothetical protein